MNIKCDNLSRSNGNPLTKWLLLCSMTLIIKIFYQYYNGLANVYEIILLGGGLFIVYVLYLRCSYYAWHALAIYLLIAIPIFYLFHKSHLAKPSFVTPVIVWSGFIFIILKLRTRYMQYLDERRNLLTDSDKIISNMEEEEKGALRDKIKIENKCIIGGIVWIVFSFILFVVLILICRKYPTEEMKKIFYLVGGLLLVWIVAIISCSIAALVRVLYYSHKVKQNSKTTLNRHNQR